jgi:hypothetical protein
LYSLPLTILLIKLPGCDCKLDKGLATLAHNVPNVVFQLHKSGSMKLTGDSFAAIETAIVQVPWTCAFADVDRSPLRGQSKRKDFMPGPK